MRLSKIPEASLKMIHAFKKGLACDNTNKTLCSHMLKNPLGISPEDFSFFRNPLLLRLPHSG